MRKMTAFPCVAFREGKRSCRFQKCDQNDEKCVSLKSDQLSLFIILLPGVICQAASVLKEQFDIRGIYALFTLWLQVKLEDQYHSYISLLNIKTAARAWLD